MKLAAANQTSQIRAQVSAPASPAAPSVEPVIQDQVQLSPKKERMSVLLEGLKGAALFGIPAAIGAVENHYLGKAVGTLAIMPNIGVGTMVGIGGGAVHGYREATEGRSYSGSGINPAGIPRAGLYGFFGGIGGAIGGGILPLAGLYGGVTGAAVATAAGAGLGVYLAVKGNRNAGHIA